MSRATRSPPRAQGTTILQKGAGDIERDAKSSAEVLRGLLKGQPPWSREVEAQRQRTRNLYLTLLFAHPLSPHSQSLEPLWQTTTYILISSYRESVSRAEAAIPGNRKKGNKMGDPEYRKNITRFRQALASEEGFYRGLIGRLVGFYQLQTLVIGHLGGVNVPVPEHVPGGGPDEGLAPIGGEEARDKLGLVYKALICLGDVERYKEQYSDHYKDRKERVRSKAGEEVFGKATVYYEVARGLIPDDGAAFNQLAVISTYLSDDFNTTYYYFRALAVRSPFRNGEEIFERFLTKLYERYRAATPEHPSGEGEEVSRCKKELLAITSIIFRRSGLSQLPKLLSSAFPALQNLLGSRQLPSEAIVKLTAIAIGTHWHARHTSSIANGHADGKRVRDAENAAVDLLLGIAKVLFDVASAELRDPASTKESALAEDDNEESLYSLISAVIRRLLPALRIVSKWLKLHIDYLSRLSPPPTSVKEFWSAYDTAMRYLALLFPIEALPGLMHPLEEDVDMRGFIPLSRGMNVSNGLAKEDEDGEDHVVHPNEEQLMRIADLQVDASLIAQIRGGGARIPPTFANAIPWIPKGRRQTDEDIASVSTQTEDDPVNLAFRATLPEDSVNGEIDAEDDEVILWSPPTTRAAQSAPAPGQANSAYDLLQNLVLESSTGSMRTPPKGSPHLNAPSGSPGLLFGGEGGIWRMTREESEKGAKRSSLAEQTRRESEAKQKEALKAIWDEPIAPLAPMPGSAGIKPSTSSGFGSTPGAGVGSLMTTPKIPAPTPAYAPIPMSSSSAWAVNDAASLYAGLSSGGWAAPAFSPHTPAGVVGAHNSSTTGWLGAPMETPGANRGYAGQTGQVAYGGGAGYGQWSNNHGAG